MVHPYVKSWKLAPPCLQYFNYYGCFSHFDSIILYWCLCGVWCWTVLHCWRQKKWLTILMQLQKPSTNVLKPRWTLGPTGRLPFPVVNNNATYVGVIFICCTIIRNYLLLLPPSPPRPVLCRVVASMEPQLRPRSRPGRFIKVNVKVEAESKPACWLSINQQVFTFTALCLLLQLKTKSC